MYNGLDELNPLRFEEPYVVEEIEEDDNFFVFKKKDKKVKNDEKYCETELDEHMINMKIRLLVDKIEKEEKIQVSILNLQEKNLYKVGAYALCMVIFFLGILCIEHWVHISWYISLKDISVTDLKSVGSLFFWPLTIMLFIGIIICMIKIILLLKRSYIVDDPHDCCPKEYDIVLKVCKKRIDGYNEEIERLKIIAYDLKKVSKK